METAEIDFTENPLDGTERLAAQDCVVQVNLFIIDFVELY